MRGRKSQRIVTNFSADHYYRALGKLEEEGLSENTRAEWERVLRRAWAGMTPEQQRVAARITPKRKDANEST
jgi:hypothetical protein